MQQHDVEDFKVFSVDVIKRAGFEFKVSGNNYDGGVLIVAKNDLLNYTSVKYFPNPKSGKEWVDGLVNSTRNICRIILEDE